MYTLSQIARPMDSYIQRWFVGSSTGINVGIALKGHISDRHRLPQEWMATGAVHEACGMICASTTVSLCKFLVASNAIDAETGSRAICLRLFEPAIWCIC